MISATAIETFMHYWRSTWPKETVTPKMHILEEHMVPFLKKWKLGCGFYGEQGGFISILSMGTAILIILTFRFKTDQNALHFFL